jgi:hypothetical protein
MSVDEYDNLLSYALSVEEAVKLKEQLERAMSTKRRPAPLKLAVDHDDPPSTKAEEARAHNEHRRVLDTLDDEQLRALNDEEMQSLYAVMSSVQEVADARHRRMQLMTVPAPDSSSSTTPM